MQSTPTVSPTNPGGRIHHSSRTAGPSIASVASSPSPMLAQRSIGGGWNDGFNSAAYLRVLQPKNLQAQRFHKRGSSGSSTTSGGPPSPLNHNYLLPQIVATSDSNFSPNYDFDFSQTPQTAKSEPSIMYPTNGFSAADMRRLQSMGAEGQHGSYNLSAPHSVSSMSHNSPATPHTNYESEYDTKDPNIYGEMKEEDDFLFDYLQFDAGYPQGPSAAYQQTLQDVFPDDFAQHQMAYNQAQENMQRLSMMQNRRSNPMAERLQAAQNDHLSPASPAAGHREKSPYRQTSEFMSANLRQPQGTPATLQKQRTSVSPKELMLDEHDIDGNSTPLFAPDHAQQMFGGNRRTTSNLSNFYTPETPIQIPQQYPFVSHSRSTPMVSELQDVNPEFPAHLVSMESTADEGSMPSSQQSIPSKSQAQSLQHSQAQPQSQQRAVIQRPEDTSSDSGTYSCTYHGCHMRFETPAKLQKHKRAGHRQTSPTSSDSPNLALRNSQAGPHRCDRINPSTKKPCNSVFSRPYDLTRHEDTIHNNRKMKVRCHLCTEEKTFSRNDALTRHMRVVHPDVDWVGKQKRQSPKA